MKSELVFWPAMTRKPTVLFLHLQIVAILAKLILCLNPELALQRSEESLHACEISVEETKVCRRLPGQYDGDATARPS